MLIYAKDDYIIAYQTNSNTGLKEYTFSTKKEKVYATFYKTKKYDSVHINKVFYINGRIFSDTSEGSSEIIKDKLLKLHETISILGYLREHNLLVASIYENEVGNLYLLDLNFKKVKFISPYTWESNPFFLITKDKFIYMSGIREGTKYDSKFWLYNVKTNKSKRLYNLEETCYNLFLYRSKTKQLLCEDERRAEKLVLVDMNGKNTEKTNLVGERLYVYDEEKDIVYHDETYFDMFRLGEIGNLAIYDFKTHKSKIIIEDIIIKDMDVINHK